MTKVAVVTPVIALLLAVGSVASAQSPADSDVAVNVAVRRDANKILLRQKLAEASDAMARRDLTGASRIYDSAVELVDQIGAANCQDEAAQAMLAEAMGYDNTRTFELADVPLERIDASDNNALIQEAMQDRPELDALRKEAEAARRLTASSSGYG